MQPGSSVIATRCDIQGYEQTERHRRVFTNTTSSDDNDPSPHHSSTARSRSRDRTSELAGAEAAPSRPVPSQAPANDEARESDRSGSSREVPTEQGEESDPQPNSEDENLQEGDDDSLLQMPIQPVKMPRLLQLTELLPPASIVTCDFNVVDQARDLLSAIPWILEDIQNVSLPSTVLEATVPYTWFHGETKHQFATTSILMGHSTTNLRMSGDVEQF